MDQPFILHMLTPLKHISPFDVNMALDSGFDSAIPYTDVELSEVGRLVQDAIFSRGPKGAKRTGVFIGGRDAILALDMLDAARAAMVPPFEISVFADPAGSFTTAAAMVAYVENTLKESHGLDLAERRVTVFGATGVVGFSAGVIAGQQGAEVVLAGYDGTDRVEKQAAEAKKRFGVDLGFADASSDSLKDELLRDTEVVLCAGRAGTQVLSYDQTGRAKALKVVADVNAVPPPGVEGVEVTADGVPLDGTAALAIGAITVGNIKYQVEKAMFQHMCETDKPVYLDFTHAFDDARVRIG